MIFPPSSTASSVQQPVEMLESLRAMPNMVVIRPADGNETSAAWAIALMNDEAPTTLALARQSTPHLDGSSVEKALRGGYVLSDMTGVGTPHPEAAPMGTAGTTDPGAPQAAETGAGNAATQTQMQSGTDDDGGTGAGAGSGSGGDFPDIILLATGSEVCIAVDAAQRLVASREPGTRVRVVSMPCADIFERQAPEYRASVLPDGVPVLAVEASSVRGWERYAHQVSRAYLQMLSGLRVARVNHLPRGCKQSQLIAHGRSGVLPAPPSPYPLFRRWWALRSSASPPPPPTSSLSWASQPRRCTPKPPRC